MSASDICRANRLYAARRSAYRAASGSGPSCPFSLNARIAERSLSSTSVMMASVYGPLFIAMPLHGGKARAAPPSLFVAALAKDGRSHPHDGRPLLDGRLVVGAHPHRQLGKREARPPMQLVAQLAQAPEVLSRVVLRGGNAHQALATKRGEVADRLHERTQIAGSDSALLRLLREVHLDEDALHRPERRGALVQFLRER